MSKITCSAGLVLALILPLSAATTAAADASQIKIEQSSAAAGGNIVDTICYDIKRVEYYGEIVDDKSQLDKLSAPILGRCNGLAALKDFLNNLVLLHRQHGFVGTQVFMPQRNNLRRGVMKVELVHRAVAKTETRPSQTPVKLKLDLLEAPAAGLPGEAFEAID